MNKWQSTLSPSALGTFKNLNEILLLIAQLCSVHKYMEEQNKKICRIVCLDKTSFAILLNKYLRDFFSLGKIVHVKKIEENNQIKILIPFLHVFKYAFQEACIIVQDERQPLSWDFYIL